VIADLGLDEEKSNGSGMPLLFAKHLVHPSQVVGTLVQTPALHFSALA
jgi:hypothetical protein